MIRFKVASFAVVLCAVSIVWPNVTSAYDFNDDTADEFNAGSYTTNTEPNGSAVEIADTALLSGVYTSSVQDAGDVMVWDTLSWTPQYAYGKAMPNYGVKETGYGNNLNTSGIQGLWHLNEAPSSTLFLDTSGLSNNGSCPTTVDSVTTNCPTADSVGSGLFDTGVVFANGQMIQTAVDVNPDVMPDTTWSAWVYPTARSGRQAILTSDDGEYDRGMVIQQSGSEYFFSAFTGTGAGSGYWITGAKAELNTWQHVVVIYSGNQVSLYKNGVSYGNSSTTGASGGQRSTYTLAIGQNPSPSYADQYLGRIDEVAVFNRALASSVIQNLYRRGALQLKFQLRSCDDAACNDEDFVGPDGTIGSFYNDAYNGTSSTPLFVPTLEHNQFVQYQATFATSDPAITPQLNSVSMTATAPTIDWSQCRVQSGEAVIPVGTTTIDVPLDTALKNITKAFLLVNSTGNSATADATHHVVSGYIKDSSTITFERGGAAGDARVSYTAVECMLNEFTVQRGAVTLSNTQASNTAVLPTAAAYSRSMVITSSHTYDTSSNTEKNVLVTGALLNDDRTVSVQRGNTSGETRVRYEVITFTLESNAQVYTNEVVYGPAATASISAPVSLSTTAVDRIWLLCSFDTNQNGIGQSTIGCAMDSNGASANFYRSAAGSQNRIRYYAVAFPAKTVTVLSGELLGDDSNLPDGERYDVPIALPSTDDTSVKAFPFVTHAMSSNTPFFPRNRWLVTLTDATTLQTSFWRSDESGTSDKNDKYWQVVQFPLYSQAVGYGWIGNADYDEHCTTNCGGVGFFSFYSDNVADASNQPYGVQLENGNGCGATCVVKGQAWAGNFAQDVDASIPNKTLGWIEFQPNLTGAPGFVDQTARWNEITGQLSGWARWTSIGQYGLDNFSQNDWGWIKLRGDVIESDGTDTGKTYGVQYDTSIRQFRGFAWNDNGSFDQGSGSMAKATGSGIGWMRFDADTTNANAAWLQTIQGDVYAKSGFNTNPAPVGEYNATYLIQAHSGGIVNFTSEYAQEQGEAFTEEDDYVAINAPVDNSRDVYRGNIGDIHVSELIEQAKQIDPDTGSDTDFGTDCVALVNALQTLSDTTPLNGRVYYCQGDLIMNKDITFINRQQNWLGAGTIVVDGNIIMQGSTYYSDTGIDSVHNIATVAWIATGTITIDSNVFEEVGAFIALGDTSGGSVSTFITQPSSLQLELYGLVLARKFSFGRTIYGTESKSTPAEKIVYDSRLFTNPPPGLENLAKGLPTIQ